MFGLGIWEFALILIVALLVLGPEKLPRVARQLGRFTRELRKAVNEFQSNLASADIEERRPRSVPSPPAITTTETPPAPTPVPAAGTQVASSSAGSPPHDADGEPSSVSKTPNDKPSGNES